MPCATPATSTALSVPARPDAVRGSHHPCHAFRYPWDIVMLGGRTASASIFERSEATATAVASTFCAWASSRARRCSSTAPFTCMCVGRPIPDPSSPAKPTSDDPDARSTVVATRVASSMPPRPPRVASTPRPHISVHDTSSGARRLLSSVLVAFCHDNRPMPGGSNHRVARARAAGISMGVASGVSTARARAVSTSPLLPMLPPVSVPMLCSTDAVVLVPRDDSRRSARSATRRRGPVPTLA